METFQRIVGNSLTCLVVDVYGHDCKLRVEGGRDNKSSADCPGNILITHIGDKETKHILIETIGGYWLNYTSSSDSSILRNLRQEALQWAWLASI